MPTLRKIRSAAEIVRDALHTELVSLLEECTGDQMEFFVRVFGKGVTTIAATLENLSDEELQNAVAICQRTVKKNRAKRGSQAAS